VAIYFSRRVEKWRSCICARLAYGVLCALLSGLFLLSGCTAQTPSNTSRVQNVSGESAARSEQMSEVVFVVPLEGAPAQTALVLADAIAAEIRDSNHPAILAYEPNQMGASVVGKVVTADQRGNVIWLTVEWAIRAPYGTHVASYQQHVVIDAGMWQNAAPEAINLLIGDAAPKIAEMVNTQVGPATFASMRRPGEMNTRAPEQAMIRSPQMSNPETIAPMAPQDVPSAPLSQPLARIAERTNGQVVMSPGASSAMPMPAQNETQPIKLSAPTRLPSLLEQSTIACIITTTCPYARRCERIPSTWRDDASIGRR